VKISKPSNIWINSGVCPKLIVKNNTTAKITRSMSHNPKAITTNSKKYDKINSKKHTDLIKVENF
jgi:hypothetical protein